MKMTTPLFPGFHLPTLRRKPRSAAQRLASERQRIREKSFSQLDECFGAFIPREILKPDKSGPFSRRRLFCKTNTFWGFFTQVLDADGGCQEVVRKFQAFAASKALPAPSSSTAAYCKARQRLPGEALQEILAHTTNQLQQRTGAQGLEGRRVVVIDGTGLSMPDTADNQARWPQQAQQKPGCGFPQARLSACFSLHSGALLSYRLGHRKQQELPLLRDQWETVQPGDILLGDKAYCSYYDIAQQKAREVDTVCTLGIRKPTARSQAVAVLGKDDWLVHWPRPKKSKRLSYSESERAALPEHLELRQIKIRVNTPGYRAKDFYLITSLTDAERYPAAAIADLYLQRWDVELFLRDLKTTMGLDILRGKSPAMVEKEILMHLIVYNCLRLLINEAAQKLETQPREISFKAAQQALRQWQPLLDDVRQNHTQRKQLMTLLIDAIAAKSLCHRPGRREPRAVKRRPKPFAILNRSRQQMEDIPHRGRYRATAA